MAGLPASGGLCSCAVMQLCSYAVGQLGSCAACQWQASLSSIGLPALGMADKPAVAQRRRVVQGHDIS